MPSIDQVLDNLKHNVTVGCVPYQPNVPPNFINNDPRAGTILSTIFGVGHPIQYHVTTRLENHLAQVAFYSSKTEKLYPYINRDVAELTVPLGPIPPSPTCQPVSGGTNPALTYYVVIVYYNGTIETGAGPETQIVIDVNHFLKVTSPPPLAGQTKYKVYASLSPIGPFYPQSGYITIGTDWTQAAPFVATGSPPLPQQYTVYYAVGRSLKDVFIEVWAPTRPDREHLADVIRQFMSDAFRQTEIDGTVSLFRYQGINDLDMEERDTIYVRQMIYQVDFVVTQPYGETQVESASASLDIIPLLAPIPPGSGS